MEVHPAYAVVLDEEGRFLKAANLRYQVGDTVRDIVELRHPRKNAPPCGSPCPAWLAWPPVCAWCSLATTSQTSPPTAPCASRSTRMWSSPSAAPTVLELEGLNEDGRQS